jgi:hypothetical protein
MANDRPVPGLRIRSTLEWKNMHLAQMEKREALKIFHDLPVFIGGECPGVRRICEDVVNALIFIADTLLDVRDSLGSTGDSATFTRVPGTVGEELRAVSGGKCSGLVTMAQDLEGASCNEALLKMNQWLKNCMEVL